MRYIIMMILLVTAGCAGTPTVRVQARPGVDFSPYHTFALLPLPEQGPANDPELLIRVGGPSSEIIFDTLGSKGLTAVELDQAELTVQVTCQFAPRTEILNWGYESPQERNIWGWRGGPMGFQDVDVNEYEERTVTVEICDVRTREKLWLGWSKSRSRGNWSSRDYLLTLQTILNKFTPKNAATASP